MQFVKVLEVLLAGVEQYTVYTCMEFMYDLL